MRATREAKLSFVFAHSFERKGNYVCKYKGRLYINRLLLLNAVRATREAKLSFVFAHSFERKGNYVCKYKGRLYINIQSNLHCIYVQSGIVGGE